ncbi:phytol kinase 1, chloroplastic isoform X2 [Magnolia sinica]|uniref:phytol kinase 1, chloroplastic isoform X2 n=1 Tax=Magnolia sinica TaxID=86752 RepID=UPI002659EC57|nr:phytol kinase 1, chloroplastic isoform X2 [Magnolia sinica]
MGRTIVSLGSSAALSFTLPPHRHRLLLLSKPRPLPRYFNLPLPSPAFLNPKLSCAPTVLRAPQCALHSHIDRSAFLQDAGATALVTAGAYMLVLAFDLLTKRNLVEQKLSRKLVHVLSGLLFMASWPLFRELLRGPLYYVLVLMLCALVFWRESPIGVIPLGIMSGGDGFADIMGRRFGALKLPYNQQKSWIGSICMCLFGFAVSIGMLYYFASLGYLRLDWVSTVEKVALISFVATLVESLPITEVVDDNISVPLTSMLMAFLFFGYGPPH